MTNEYKMKKAPEGEMVFWSILSFHIHIEQFSQLLASLIHGTDRRERVGEGSGEREKSRREWIVCGSSLALHFCPLSLSRCARAVWAAALFARFDFTTSRPAGGGGGGGGGGR